MKETVSVGEAAADESKACENAKKSTEIRRKRRKKDISSEKLQPLKTAAERIADMLCSLSGDTELFVISQDEKQQRRVDTKTLKEFSSVIKEISGVICELNGISPLGTPSDGNAVRIEFEGDAEECSR